MAMEQHAWGKVVLCQLLACSKTTQNQGSRVRFYFWIYTVFGHKVLNVLISQQKKNDRPKQEPSPCSYVVAIRLERLWFRSLEPGAPGRLINNLAPFKACEHCLNFWGLGEISWGRVPRLQIIFGEILSLVETWIYRHHISDYSSDVLALPLGRRWGQLSGSV